MVNRNPAQKRFSVSSSSFKIFPLTEMFKDAFNIAAKAATVELLSKREERIRLLNLPKLTGLLNSLCQGNRKWMEVEKTECELMVQKMIPG